MVAFLPFYKLKICNNLLQTDI